MGRRIDKLTKETDEVFGIVGDGNIKERGVAGHPLVLPERAQSECARSTAAVQGIASLPVRRICSLVGKRVRRSLRSVARTERLNRFAPRAKSIAADYYLFDCLSNFVCGEAFVDVRGAHLGAPAPLRIEGDRGKQATTYRWSFCLLRPSRLTFLNLSQST